MEMNEQNAANYAHERKNQIAQNAFENQLTTNKNFIAKSWHDTEQHKRNVFMSIRWDILKFKKNELTE